MPVRNPFDDSGGPRSRTALFWVGGGLVPIAALMLLVADGSATLRIGAVLALLAAVLIGLASALHTGGGSARPDLAETLAGQRDEIRGEVRAEVAAGAQATHRTVGGQLRSLRDEIEALRGQVDAIWAGTAVPGLPFAGGHASVGATYSATARGEAAAYSYGGGHEPAAAGIGVAAVPQPEPPRPRASSGRAGVPPAGGAPRPHVPAGVVRHTETVQVTTRQTIVEPDGDRSNAAYGSGSGYYGAAAGWSAPAQRRRPVEREPDRAGQSEEFAAEPHGSDGDDEVSWTGSRARERWAAARDDGGGREVRIGQRRAHVRADKTGTEVRFEDRWAAVREGAPDRHEAPRGGWRSAGSWQNESASYPDPAESNDPADPDGRNRWAGGEDSGDWRHDSGDLGGQWAEADGRAEWADRGADPADHGWNGHPDDQGWNDQGWNDGDQLGGAALEPAWEQQVPAALPAGRAAVGSWQAWSEPERQPVRREHGYRDDREAYGLHHSDGVPRAGGRQLGFERTDSRWG